MLEMLEKLINEHGSSTILRERLELFSDKYSMLEEKITHLQLRNQELEGQLQEAKEEISRLQDIVEAHSESQNSSILPDVTASILKYFFDAAADLTTEQICRQFSLEHSVAQYHIDNLKEQQLLAHGTLFVNQPIRYRISKPGRAFVIENGIT